ncbi:MAG: hypothetical protein JWM80_102 [Cyanobacteria bacterium RYN_339]|nr:hypothetical protein [Cyanobacteria bacterium RYN_339]
MSSLQMTSSTGAKQTFTNVEKVAISDFQAKSHAALHDGKDNVMVVSGGDVYIASGKLDKGFSPTSATLDDKAVTIKGTQLEKDEPTTFWRKLKAGMNFPAVQVGAGSALAGMLGGAWIAGNFFGSAMPVMWGIAAGAAVLGFLTAAFVQGSTESTIPTPDLTKWVEKKVNG